THTLGHTLGEGVPWALHAGQIDEHDLAVAPAANAADRATRGLRAIRDDRDLIAHDEVDERGLADVRPPGERDEAAAGHSLCGASSRRCRASISPSSVS